VTKLRISLLHVEDDSLWQMTIATALRALPEVEKYESATTVALARERAARLRPDVVLLDIVLGDGDGLALARELNECTPAPRIILLSVRRDDVVLQSACEGHAAGVLWKSSDVFVKLPEAIRTVASGGRYYPVEVREALRRFRADPEAYFKILSDREIELLPHFGQGLSDDEIAGLFRLSTHTIKSHRQKILSKLNLHSTARLIHWAIMRGFVRPPSDGWTARENGGNESRGSLYQLK
jgi:DNA-binding NarL/FixJ family response regulator